MTCCAYDGEYLAADQLLTESDGTRIGYEKKILKWKGGIWTSAGRITDAELFSMWLDGEDVKMKLHKDFGAFFTCDGKIYQMDNTGVPYPAYKNTAIGCGGPAAMILMKYGLSAKEAVQEVIKQNAGCGGKIDVVKVRS